MRTERWLFLAGKLSSRTQARLAKILVAAFIGGLRVSLLVTVLSFLAGWYFFLPPADSCGRKTLKIRTPNVM